MDLANKICFTFLIISIALFIIFSLINFANGYKYGSYLDKHRKKISDEISTSWIFGPGLINPYKSLRYLFSRHEDDDIFIINQKIKLRKGLKLLLFLLICIFINLMILSYLNKS